MAVQSYTTYSGSHGRRRHWAHQRRSVDFHRRRSPTAHCWRPHLNHRRRPHLNHRQRPHLNHRRRPHLPHRRCPHWWRSLECIPQIFSTPHCRHRSRLKEQNCSLRLTLSKSTSLPEVAAVPLRPLRLLRPLQPLVKPNETEGISFHRTTFLTGLPFHFLSIAEHLWPPPFSLPGGSAKKRGNINHKLHLFIAVSRHTHNHYLFTEIKKTSLKVA